MQFNSYIFVLCFLPICVCGYWLINKISYKMADYFLILMSLMFYGYTNIRYIEILGVSIAINYIAYRWIRKSEKYKKYIFCGAIGCNVLILVYFKYLNFFMENLNAIFKTDYNFISIFLPLGISFFTFQQIGFLNDVYQNKIKEVPLSDYFLFMMYFPKISQGPITPYGEIMEQFHDKKKRKIDYNHITKGIQMFTIGLFKKLILGDTFGLAVAWGFSNVAVASAMDMILVGIFYTFQIYFDFSGYSDMANGISYMFNIELPMNFNSPYKASSILDFWRRWHISLTKFLRTYIYFPLGGSKKGNIRTYLNTMIVFGVSGLWHGANWTFVLWGLLHGLASCLNRIFKEKYEKFHVVFQWGLTFIFLNVTWLLFRAENIQQFMGIVNKIVRLENLNISQGLISCFDLVEIRFWLETTGLVHIISKINGFYIWMFIGLAFSVCLNMENAQKKLYKNSFVSAIVCVFMLSWCIISLGNVTGFLYFGF